MQDEELDPEESESTDRNSKKGRLAGFSKKRRAQTESDDAENEVEDASVGGKGMKALKASKPKKEEFCDAHSENVSTGRCGVCKRAVCKECGADVSGWKQDGDGSPLRIKACPRCLEGIEDALEDQIPTVSTMMSGAAGGIVAALVGAGVWAGIMVAFNYEIGYLAIVVGLLVGAGVKVGAMKARGAYFQIVSCLCAVFSLVLAKYIWFVYIVNEFGAGLSLDDPDYGVEFSYFSFETVTAFLATTSEWLSGFDALWIVLAVLGAYKIAAAAKVEIKYPRGVRPLGAYDEA
ncbi:MAG: hypothetical protein NUW37_16240 [Planctomycetes bacterium]|nr:hypothetical protein [Planctomycetota bacterium]